MPGRSPPGRRSRGGRPARSWPQPAGAVGGLARASACGRRHGWGGGHLGVRRWRPGWGGVNLHNGSLGAAGTHRGGLRMRGMRCAPRSSRRGSNGASSRSVRGIRAPRRLADDPAPPPGARRWWRGHAASWGCGVGVRRRRSTRSGSWDGRAETLEHPTRPSSLLEAPATPPRRNVLATTAPPGATTPTTQRSPRHTTRPRPTRRSDPRSKLASSGQSSRRGRRPGLCPRRSMLRPRHQPERSADAERESTSCVASPWIAAPRFGRPLRRRVPGRQRRLHARRDDLHASEPDLGPSTNGVRDLRDRIDVRHKLLEVLGPRRSGELDVV